MGRGPFDEAIFWHIRVLQAWEDEPALVFTKPAASIWKKKRSNGTWATPCSRKTQPAKIQA